MSNSDFISPSAMEAVKAVEKNPGPEQMQQLTRAFDGLTEQQLYTLSNEIANQSMKQIVAHPELPFLTLIPESGETYQYEHDHPVQPRSGEAAPQAWAAAGDGAKEPNEVDYRLSINTSSPKEDVSTELYHREFINEGGVRQDIKFAPPTIAAPNNGSPHS